MLRHDNARPDTRPIAAPASSFWRLLPSRLGDLPASVRTQLGPALDRGAVRFVVDSVDGQTLVTRGVRA